MIKSKIASPMRRVRSVVSAPLRRRFGRVSMSRPYELATDVEDKSLAGTVAVVTGGSGAIGRAISVRLATKGAYVHIVGRNAERLNGVVAEIRALGFAGEAHQVDLLDDAAVKGLFDALPALDVLINNAGGSSRGDHAYLWDQRIAVVDDVIATNLRASMHCTMHAAARMVTAGRGGSILNLGSTVAAGGKARFSEYAAAKAGLVGYTRSAALELGLHGIRVNCLSPGVIARGDLLEREIAHERAKNVLGRLGTPEDIAELASFLVSSRASFITGQNFIVDGGRSLGLYGDS